MSVWLTIPSKRPPVETTLHLWKRMGYKIAVCCDPGAEEPLVDHVFSGPYQGYAKSVNFLIGWLMANEPDAEWFIAAGDDIEPDANHSADEIAAQCFDHFRGTFGVMQPTGDRWGDSPESRKRFGEDKGAYIDRVCGSAWIGRQFVKCAYQGTTGPLWPEYFHMFVDQELNDVAENLGVLWRRPDLIHLHRHWGRGPLVNPNHPQTKEIRMPEFLTRANSAEEWAKAKKLFEQRKAAGFPGSEVIG